MMDLFAGITHIVFDLDGLLIDSEPLWNIAEDQALQAYGKRWSAEISKQHIGLRVDEAAHIMVKAYELGIDPAPFAEEIYMNMLQLLEEQLDLMAGANETIQTLHEYGYPLAIASSSAEAYIQTVVDKYDWGQYISVIASAYNVPFGKPAPDVYLEAARLLKIAPEKCLALEDSLNGAKAAKAANMKAVAIPGHDFIPADFDGVADQTFPTLLDFLLVVPH